MRSFCNAKPPHIFSAKNISTLDFRRTRRLNESLTNDFVKLMMLWTTGPRMFRKRKESCKVEWMPMHIKWAPSSEFVSSSIPSWHISTAHAQSFRGARDLIFCLKVPLDSLLVWASSEGSGKTARMRRLAWTFAARIGDKYQIRLTRSKWSQRENASDDSFKYKSDIS